MVDEILDRDLDENPAMHRRYRHFAKWAKRWSWFSVIILFMFILFSGVLIPIFKDRTNNPGVFLGQTLAFVATFLALLTLSNLFSLYYRWKGFNILVDKADRDYFNLFISILFLLAPIVIMMLLLGF